MKVLLVGFLIVLITVSSSYAQTYAFTKKSINSESKRKLFRVALEYNDLQEVTKKNEADFLVTVFKLDNPFHGCSDLKKFRGIEIVNAKTKKITVKYECSWKDLADSVSDGIELPN